MAEMAGMVVMAANTEIQENLNFLLVRVLDKLCHSYLDRLGNTDWARVEVKQALQRKVAAENMLILVMLTDESGLVRAMLTALENIKERIANLIQTDEMDKMVEDLQIMHRL